MGKEDMEMNTPVQKQEIAAAVEPLREKIDHWRKTRTVIGRMPEALWQEATVLAKTHGVAAVQGILRIDYQGLKQRVFGPLAEPPPGRKEPPRFVELPPLPATAARRPEHTIELEDGAGRRLTVKVSGGNLADILPLAQSFWRL